MDEKNIERVTDMVMPSAKLVRWAEAFDCDENEVVVDYTSSREGYLMSFGCLALFVTPIGVLASLGTKSVVAGWLWLAAAALGPVLLYLRWLISDHYIVNFSEKTIDHVRVFRGIAALNIQRTETRNKFLNFEQLHSLILSRYSTKDKSPGRGSSYQVLLVCQDGQILMWADVGRNLEAGKRLGNRFAEKMGIPFDASDASAPIKIKRTHQGIEVCRERAAWFNLRRFWSDGDGKKPDADS